MDIDLDKSYRTCGFAVLLADDQKFMIKNLERYFVNFFDIQSAATLDEAKSILQTQKIAVVVADHQMLNGQGLDLLELVRDEYSNIRRIIITADRDEQLVIDMMRGKLAHSFVYKPTVKPQLHSAVASQIEIFLAL